MSQPQRFDCDGCGMFASKDGEWVDWDDYASLAAEYVELKDLYLKCRIDIGNLHKENERLRKAGDAMAVAYNELHFIYNVHSTTQYEPATITDWLAAKEGGDAK